MRLAIATATAIIIMSGLLIGCTTSRNLSQTEQQAILQAYNAQAQQLATDTGDNHIAEFASQVPQSGASGWCRVTRPTFGLDGQVLRNPDGTYVMETQEAIGKSNMMRGFAGVDEAIFKLAGVAVNPRTGELQLPDTTSDAINRGGMMEGVFLWMRGSGGNSGMDAEFAAVWAEASTAEKRAAAAAVKEYLEAQKGLITEVITAGGDVAVGVLKEVGKATPYGAGLAIVDAVVTDDDGDDIPGQIIQPFAGMPGEIE